MTIFSAVAVVFTAVATAFAAMASGFLAVVAQNTGETAVTNTAATSLKFILLPSKMSFSVREFRNFLVFQLTGKVRINVLRLYVKKLMSLKSLLTYSYFMLVMVNYKTV